MSVRDFSQREMEILQLMKYGKKEQEMADVLEVSLKTVQNDKKKIIGIIIDAMTVP